MQRPPYRRVQPRTVAVAVAVALVVTLPAWEGPAMEALRANLWVGYVAAGVIVFAVLRPRRESLPPVVPPSREVEDEAERRGVWP